METISFNIYKFEELNEEAQARAIENSRSFIAENLCSFNDDDFRGTLDKIEDVFQIKVRDLEYIPQFSLTSSKWRDVEDEEGGKMLLRYLEDVECALDNRKRYYRNSKKRIARTMHEEYCYCLTGVYSDSAVDKVLNNMYDAVRRGDSIRDFIKNMLEDFADSWTEANNSSYDDEVIKDEIISLDMDFREDGRRYC